ncbi:MAG TPA: hypothetical protein VJ406_01260, partial [Dehalococcoidia bacterium]|nr:hypothetical protein [Dehalococcoidia bacterium]
MAANNNFPAGRLSIQINLSNGHLTVAGWPWSPGGQFVVSYLDRMPGYLLPLGQQNQIASYR